MKSFRNPKYLERYEDVIFDLEQAINTADPANNAAQVRAPNLKFIADNAGEATPFDWYNARMSMDFKVGLLAGGNIAVAARIGIVNGSNSFIKKLTILAYGKEVYSCNEANNVANIKKSIQRVLEPKNFTILILRVNHREILRMQNLIQVLL